MRNRWEEGPPHTRFQVARPRSLPPKSALKEDSGDKEEDPEETARQVAAMETMLKTLGPMVDTCDWAKKQHKELTDKLKKLKSTSEELPLDFRLKSYFDRKSSKEQQITKTLARIETMKKEIQQAEETIAAARKDIEQLDESYAEIRKKWGEGDVQEMIATLQAQGYKVGPADAKGTQNPPTMPSKRTRADGERTLDSDGDLIIPDQQEAKDQKQAAKSAKGQAGA